MNSVKRLAKIVFIISFILCFIVLSNIIITKINDKKEYDYFIERAINNDNMTHCENIKNLRFSVLCYSEFIKKGDGCDNENSENPACLIALAAYNQDELFCDKVFPPEDLPYNLECRVTIFIERYTDEGFNNCCNIK